MIKLKNILVEERGPCWKGYKQVGMKDKGGKEVPNCVPESIVKESKPTTSSAPGQWVAFLSMTRGKKLLKTFDSARGAKMFLSKNVDKLLGGANVESVGIMAKQKWDEREAKYAIEGINECGCGGSSTKLTSIVNGSIVREAGIPKLYLKIEAVKKEIERLIAERKSKYGGEYAKKLNAETDPKKREQLKKPILAISQKITKLQSNLADMYEKEEKYYANMGKDDELDPNFA